MPVRAENTTKSKKKATQQVTEPGTSALAQKAMLARLTVHWWMTWASDEDATAELEESKNAKKKVSVVRKKLLGKSWRPMWSVCLKLRKFHHFMSLPWDDDGYRLLSSAAYSDYVSGVNELIAELEIEKSKFRAIYKDEIEEDRNRLGDMFNEEDYLPIEEIDKKIGADIKVRPIPEGKHFVTDIGDEEMARVRKSIDDDAQETIKKAVGDVWSRLAEVVGRMVDGLNKYQPKTETEKASGAFKDSLIGNIIEVLHVVPVLNILNDPEIDKFAADIREKLTTNTAAVLRYDDSLRKTVATEAQEILDKMNAYLN